MSRRKPRLFDEGFLMKKCERVESRVGIFSHKDAGATGTIRFIPYKRGVLTP
jgi:hypothetical protein